MTPNDSTGVNLLLAIRDHAQGEAESLERDAADLRVRAAAMEKRAEVLRAIYVVAAPNFPASQRQLRAG